MTQKSPVLHGFNCQCRRCEPLAHRRRVNGALLLIFGVALSAVAAILLWIG